MINLSIVSFTSILQVYIISICAKSLSVEGRYCLVDRQWRCSTGCSIIGALLVIGSEESVFIMTLITTVRMGAVLWQVANTAAQFQCFFINGFIVQSLQENRGIHIRHICVLLLFTWILSLTIALIPLIPSFEDYFVNSIWRVCVSYSCMHIY